MPTHDPRSQYEEAQSRISAEQQERTAALSLASLGLNALPPEIGSLTYLLTLYLTNNQLAALPSAICSFTRLTVLSLGDNQLTELPSELGDLAALKVLDVQHNRLRSLPRELVKLTSLERLYLHDNPALGLPNELLGPDSDHVNSGRAAPKLPKQILQYYFDVLESGLPLQECKLIVVGRGGAGIKSAGASPQV